MFGKAYNNAVAQTQVIKKFFKAPCLVPVDDLSRGARVLGGALGVSVDANMQYEIGLQPYDLGYRMAVSRTVQLIALAASTICDGRNEVVIGNEIIIRNRAQGEKDTKRCEDDKPESFWSYLWGRKN